MPTKEDIEQAIEFCGDLKTIAEGFGVTLGRLKTLIDVYEIKVKNVSDFPKKKDKAAEGEKKKPYIHPADENGVRCEWKKDKGNKTARRCLYGGTCGNIDCCDYYLLTGNMRPIVDPKDTHYCVAFTPIPKSQKQKMNRTKGIPAKREFMNEWLEKRKGDT